jgi:Protein of unknown function (DUF3551)
MFGAHSEPGTGSLRDDCFPLDGRKHMRVLMITALFAAAVGSFWVPKPAQARDYKYCLYEHNDTAGDCSFSTYAQCQASASGRVAYCNINPRYAFAMQRRGRTYQAPANRW